MTRTGAAIPVLFFQIHLDSGYSMLEMIALVKQFQSAWLRRVTGTRYHFLPSERKTTKNSAKSAAFEAKKDALYTEARKNAANAVKEGVAYMLVFL